MDFYLEIRSPDKRGNNSMLCDLRNIELAYSRLRLPEGIRRVVNGWANQAEPGMMMTVTLPNEGLKKEKDETTFRIFSLADGPAEKTYQSFQTKPAVEVVPYNGRPCQLAGELTTAPEKARLNDDEEPLEDDE